MDILHLFPPPESTAARHCLDLPEDARYVARPPSKQPYLAVRVPNHTLEGGGVWSFLLSSERDRADIYLPTSSTSGIRTVFGSLGHDDNPNIPRLIVAEQCGTALYVRDPIAEDDIAGTTLDRVSNGRRFLQNPTRICFGEYDFAVQLAMLLPSERSRLWKCTSSWPDGIIERKWKTTRTCLGGGSQGKVFVSRGMDTGLEAATKRVRIRDTRDRERTRAEVHTLLSLTHENVVPFYAASEYKEGSREYIDIHMMRCESSLEDLSERGQGLLHFDDLGKQIVTGVQYLHASRVVHRDLKPENVLIKHGGGKPRAVLCDFGVSKLDWQINKTSTETPMFWAREVALAGVKNMSYGFSADMFSLGILLAAMLVHETVLRIAQGTLITGTFPTPEKELEQYHKALRDHARSSDVAH